MVRVIFCMPGKTYHREFLLAWTDLVMNAASKGHELSILQFPTLRQVSEALANAPPYDISLWIGPNVLFNPTNFFDLLESPHDVTSGYFVDEVPETLSFQVTVGVPVSLSDIPKDRYFSAARTKLGWLMIKNGQSCKGSLDDFQAFEGLHIDTKVRIGNHKAVVV